MSAGGAVEALWSLERRDAFVVPNYEGAHAALYEQMSRRSDGAVRACLDRVRPDERVLDLGCGTGRLTARLAARGHQVTGVDAAPAMLERARARLERNHTDAQLVNGDLRDRHEPGDYDVVTLVGLTFSLFTAPEERRGVLRAAARSARPGGRILLDYLPLDGVTDSLEHWAVPVRLGPMQGHTLIEVRRDVAERVQVADLYTQLVRTDARCVHMRSTTVSALVPDHEVHAAALQCGLRVVERSDPDYELGRFVVLARHDPVADGIRIEEEST